MAERRLRRDRFADAIAFALVLLIGGGVWEASRSAISFDGERVRHARPLDGPRVILQTGHSTSHQQLLNRYRSVTDAWQPVGRVPLVNRTALTTGDTIRSVKTFPPHWAATHLSI